MAPTQCKSDAEAIIDSEHGVCSGMAFAAVRRRGECASAGMGVPFIGETTETRKAGKCTGTPGREHFTECPDVVIRTHPRRTDPDGANHFRPVQRCVDTYAALSEGLRRILLSHVWQIPFPADAWHEWLRLFAAWFCYVRAQQRFWAFRPSSVVFEPNSKPT